LKHCCHDDREAPNIPEKNPGISDTALSLQFPCEAPIVIFSLSFTINLNFTLFFFSLAATDAETGCCKCQDLNTVGWMSVILLVLLFWPLCWIPCLIASCHDPTARPIYGWPNQQQQQQQQQQFYAPQQAPVVAPPQK